jgi:lysine-arginine-ornithine-binding protein
MISMRMLGAALACAIVALAGGGAAAGDWSKVRVGTEGTYRPFNYIDAGGQLRGLDVDIVDALCSRIAASCSFVTIQNDGLLPALQEGKVDAVATGWSITAKRLKVIDFTDRYYTNYRRFLACPGSTVADTSPAAMKGRTIGTQGGTASNDYLDAYYKDSDLRLYKSMDDAYADLGAGRLDAVFASEATSYDFMQGDAGKDCKFVGDRPVNEKYFGAGVGIALRKADTDLRDKLNAALKQIIADGTYDAIVKRYFPFSIY